jgi:gliding motility-associated-like protein
MKKNILILLLIIPFCNAFAQFPIPPNCPPPTSTNNLVITASNIATCGNPVTLNANVTTNVATTSSYLVAPTTTYNPYPWIGANSITPIINVDDTWSGVLNIPFTFCFYGNAYTQFVVSSNGSVSFDLTNAGGFSAWATSTWGPMPVPTATSGGEFNNCILGPHHDVLPSASTSSKITWDVYGTAPCRALVVSWDSVPLFSCTAMKISQQIVMYESSNIIDIYVKEKTMCSGWNGGIAYEGVQNATATAATAVPGRDGQQFTCLNDGQRFLPNGPPSNTVTWYNASNNAVIGTGNSVTVSPNNTNSYYAVASIGSCGSGNLTLTDTYTVVVAIPVIANFIEDVNLGCIDDTIVFTNTSTNGQTAIWSFGDGGSSIATNPTHIYVNQGIYTVTLIAGMNNLCFDTISKVFNLNHPINAAFFTNYSAPPTFDSLCVGNSITINNFSIGGGLVSTFDMGNGVTIVKNNTAPFQYTYPVAGIYNILLTVVDTLGCIDTFSRQMFVDNAPWAQLAVSDSFICLGEPVFFNDTVAPYTKAFTYNFGDGIIIKNVHDPAHTYETDGTFNVTFTADYLICPDLVLTMPVTVDKYPIVNLGPDTSICPGLTAGFLLNANNSGANNYLWSNGTTLSSLPVAEPNYYWVRAGFNSCYATDSIWVKRDCYINIPNSFTPGGTDPLNNYFMPAKDLQSGIAVYNLNIYNRWGETVFTTTNLNSRGWDGMFGGKPQPMGVYVYAIRVTFKNGETHNYNGNVTLLR